MRPQKSIKVERKMGSPASAPFLPPVRFGGGGAISKNIKQIVVEPPERVFSGVFVRELQLIHEKP